jgi:glycogen debranching enzyme
MALVLVRPTECYAWRGQSLLITNTRGDCDESLALSGFYFREVRALRTIRLEVNGKQAWPCELAATDPTSLDFLLVHPELTDFGGGGSGQSQDQVSVDEHGVPHRAVDLRLRYQVHVASLQISLIAANRSPQRSVELDIAWRIDADFADIQEALAERRQQSAPVRAHAAATQLELAYEHPRLPYRTRITPSGGSSWTIITDRLSTHVQLDPQASVELTLDVVPVDYIDQLNDEDVREREHAWRAWRERLTSVRVPGNTIVEQVIASNVRDIASFPLLQGRRDEWLVPQAGVPLYPALFGRDAFTTGFQLPMIDRGEMVEAAVARLARLQSDRVFDWRDEQPGRIPYQIRQGPLARLDINPYSAYYADFASPMMLVVALAHAFAWSGETALIERHWDTVRRVMDWAREYGDADGDGYLEYCTRSSEGTKNQGWKDSGNAILYENGDPVPAPLGTCELQGYWFAAQQMVAALAWATGKREDAKAYWRSAMDLKERFNRDWWMEDEGFFALAMDPDKRLVRAVTSNVGQCIATGIVDDEHISPVVGRMFAPDLFSGWGIRTLSSRDRSYNPIDYHLGSVWAVENASIVFGLKRFGFDQRAIDLSKALIDLACLYPDYRIPECVGGYARGERPTPGSYPRSNTPQLWNASVFPLVLQSILGLQPIAPLSMLIIDPVLPEWLPEVVLEGLRLGGATATVRFWRDRDGKSHGEALHTRGSFHLLRQPPVESTRARLRDRFGALVETILH